MTRAARTTEQEETSVEDNTVTTSRTIVDRADIAAGDVHHTDDDDDAGQTLAEPLLPPSSSAPSSDSPHCCGRWWKYCCGCFGSSFCRRRRSTSSAPAALIRARTTPLVWKILLPLAILFTHWLFYYGQTKPMWKLVIQQQHINATMHAHTFEAQSIFDTLGLSHSLQYTEEYHEKVVRSFDYKYAIQELWKAKHMPGKVLPRMAAALLVVFSGVWPHLKLLWLHGTFFFHPRPTQTLHWLAVLGKWSLADVLVVCVMVGVLHLDWHIVPEQILDGIIEELPILLPILRDMYTATDLCSRFLHKGCDDPHSLSTKTKCQACRTLVNNMLTHPSTARDTLEQITSGVETSGGGLVSLRVVGMRGIYAFCAAVIASIALSLVVDVLNVRAKRYQREEQEYERFLQRRQRARNVPVATFFSASEDNMLDDESLPDEEDAGDRNIDNGNRGSSSRYSALRVYYRAYGNMVLAVFSFATVVLAWNAVMSPMLRRHVTGAIPKLLREGMGVHFDHDFSLSQLSRTTGAAGGWDLLLQATFSLFIVTGPLLRGVLCVVAFVLPESDSLRRQRFLTAIDFLGAFCAWEVFAVAVYMVALLMPSVTSTVIIKPQCLMVPDETSCLEVFFDPNRKIGLIVTGGVLLVALAWISTLQIRRQP